MDVAEGSSSEKKKFGYYNYVPTTGVRADIKKLMNTFLSHNTVRYEKFSEIWREMNMSFFLACRSTDREAREYLERVFLIALEYFLSPYQFHVRVCGLYLLYGLYEIQPLVPKVKIRLTQPQWMDTMFLQKQAALQSHLDVVYVFNRLLVEQAFHFCFTQEDMSMKRGAIDVVDNVASLADDLREERTRINQLFKYESVEQLTYLQDQYKQMKICLAGPNATRPNKSLNVVQDSLVDSLMISLQSFREKVSRINRFGLRKDYMEDGESELEEDEEDFPEEESLGNKRLEIKNRAMAQVIGDQNKRYNLVVESGNENSSDQKSPSKVKAKNKTASNSESNDEELPSLSNNQHNSMPVIEESIVTSCDEDSDDEEILSLSKQQREDKPTKGFRKKGKGHHKNKMSSTKQKTSPPKSTKKNQHLSMTNENDNLDLSSDENIGDEDYVPPTKRQKRKKGAKGKQRKEKSPCEDHINSINKSPTEERPNLKNKIATRQPIAERKKSPIKKHPENSLPKKRGRKKKEPEPEIDLKNFADFKRKLREESGLLSSSESDSDKDVDKEQPSIKIRFPRFSKEESHAIEKSTLQPVDNSDRSSTNDKCINDVKFKKSEKFNDTLGNLTCELLRKKQCGEDAFFKANASSKKKVFENLDDKPLPEITQFVFKGSIGKKSINDTIKEMMQASKAKIQTSDPPVHDNPVKVGQKVKVVKMVAKGNKWEMQESKEREYKEYLKEEIQKKEMANKLVNHQTSPKKQILPEEPVSKGGFDMLFEDTPMEIPNYPETYVRKHIRGVHAEETDETQSPGVKVLSQCKSYKYRTKYKNHIQLANQNPNDIFMEKYIEKLKKERLKEVKRLKNKEEGDAKIWSKHMIMAKKLAVEGNIDCMTVSKVIKKKLNSELLVDKKVEKQLNILQTTSNDSKDRNKKNTNSDSSVMPKILKSYYI